MIWNGPIAFLLDFTFGFLSHSTSTSAMIKTCHSVRESQSSVIIAGEFTGGTSDLHGRFNIKPNSIYIPRIVIHPIKIRL